MKKINIFIFILLSCYVWQVAAPKNNDNGQENATEQRKVLTAVRINQDVKIDGKLDEPFYTTIQPADSFFQYHPENGAKMTFDTQVYAYYDKKNIYFAFKCFDDEPEKIAADVTPFGEFVNNDEIKIYLDTFNDKQTYDMFVINPKGIKGGKETVWDADARITPEGWVAEVKIPFKSLRFPVRDVQDWRVNFRRVINRFNERGFWTYLSREKHSAFGDTFGILEGLHGIEGGNNLEVFPYAGVRNSVSGDDKDNKFAYGLDLKYGITSNLTLDFTSSPDYSEVESDPFFYQTAPYEVRLQERRPFYQEGSSYFDTHFFLFYSRRISDPLVAAKITGKEKGFSLGALGALNDNKTTGYKDFFGVFRLKKDIAKMSHIGMIYTSVEGEDEWNRNIGFDFQYTFKDIYHISGMAAFTFNKDQERSQNGLYHIEFMRNVDKGFIASMLYDRVEANVDVSTGYINYVNFQAVQSYWGYIFRREGKWLENINLIVFQTYQASATGNLEVQNTFEFAVEFYTRSRLSLVFSRQIGKGRAQVLDNNSQLVWDDKMYPNKFYYLLLSYSGSRFIEFANYLLFTHHFVYNDGYTGTKEGELLDLSTECTFKFSPRLHWRLVYNKVYHRSLDRTIKFDGNLFASILNIQLSKRISSFIKLQYDAYQKRFQYDFLIGYEPANVSRIYLSIKNYSEDHFRFFSPDARTIAFKVSYLLRF